MPDEPEDIKNRLLEEINESTRGLSTSDYVETLRMLIDDLETQASLAEADLD